MTLCCSIHSDWERYKCVYLCFWNKHIKDTSISSKMLQTIVQAHKSVGDISWLPIDVGRLSLLCLVYPCLSEGFCCCMKHHDHKRKLWRKGCLQLLLPHCSSSPKEVRTGTHTGQEPGGRSWYRGHGGVLLTGLLLVTCSAFLLEPWTTHSGLDYSLIFGRHFLTEAPSSLTTPICVKLTYN